MSPKIEYNDLKIIQTIEAVNFTYPIENLNLIQPWLKANENWLRDVCM